MTLRALATLVGLTVPSLASAQMPEPTQEAPTPEPSMVEKMTMGARNAARDGRCDTLAIIGKRVRELDETYYREMFAVDPVIAGCVQGQRAPERDLSLQTGPLTLTPPSLTPPSLTPVDEEAPLPRGDYKSPATAAALSFGVTGGGILLAIMAGQSEQHDLQATLGWTSALLIAVGPTTGHIYADNGWNPGLKYRLGSLGLFTGSMVGALALCPPFSQCTNEGGAAALAVVAVGAGITYLGASVYEMATAAEAARTYNRTHDVGISVSVAPMIGSEPGLAVFGRF